MKRSRIPKTPTAPIPPLADLLLRTRIEVPAGPSDSALVPFDVWPAQREMIASLETERLIAVLKARQLGISWLTIGYVWRCSIAKPGQTWLLFSQGQSEANELLRRIGVLHSNYDEPRALPTLTKEITGQLAWSNGSRILSMAATKKAGRSFTASGVLLDEWAFMQWGRDLLAAVKPTIDAGGQLIIISSADGNGSAYHQFWQNAKAGASGYLPIFLPWHARPDRGPGWRDEKIVEANGDVASVLREYPANDIEAFTAATGLIYADAWSDGPDDGNVTETAEYDPSGGQVYWALDDGYSAGTATSTSGKDAQGYYISTAHPRAILLCQERTDGGLNIFAESYACLTLSDVHIADVLDNAGYPAPSYVAHGPGSAEIRGRIFHAGLMPVQSTANVRESIKEMRRALAKDSNGWRRVRVHPRCVQLRREMASYANDPVTGEPIKAFDHGPDAVRGLLWLLRGMQ